MMLAAKYMQQEFMSVFGCKYDTEKGLQNFASAQPNGYYENEQSAFIIVVKQYQADFNDGLQYSKKCLRKILSHIDSRKQIYIIIAVGNSVLTFSYTVFRVLRETRQLQRLCMKLSQLNEITFTVASDSDSVQCCGSIPVTQCNCDDCETVQEFYRLSGDELYKYRLHQQLTKFENDVIENVDKGVYWPRKTFTQPVYVKITGYNRISIDKLFVVIGIVPTSQRNQIQKGQEIYNIIAGKKIIILESKLISYPNIDAFLLTIEKQIGLLSKSDKEITTDFVKSMEIDIPVFV